MPRDDDGDGLLCATADNAATEGCHDAGWFATADDGGDGEGCHVGSTT